MIDDIIRMAREAGLDPDLWNYTDAFERFAAIVAADERNKLAAWMMAKGYATGHGDTMEQLLDALDTELADRQWVGLTDDEIKEIIGPWGPTPINGYTRKLFDQIEAKLKEKNT